MLDYDEEANILNDLHELKSKECLILSDKEMSPNYIKTASILDTILSDDYLSKWIDNSVSKFPPDFVNESDNLIMEVMRFDDHSSDGKTNPVLARERLLSKEAKDIKSLYPNARLHIIAVTNLPTEEDHNYRFLYSGFQRTIRKHLSKLDTYKINYPNKETIFLVLNEASGIYLENVAFPLCKPHLIFLDNRFIKEFINSDLDYLILYSPYNHFKTLEEHQELPKAVIFDVKHLKKNKLLEFIDYDENKMISSEL